MKRKRTLLIGLAFLVCLILSYFGNTVFLSTLSVSSRNPLALFLMILSNNVAVVSLILLGMAFYVNLVVSGFFKREKHAHVVLDHPRVFAAVFAFVILFLSILRGANFFLGTVIVQVLPLILLVSTPIGIIEGYGIYMAINKTLSRTLTLKNLIYIYGIFLVAAVIEVSFIGFLSLV